MLPDRAIEPRTLTYESGALPIALRDPATFDQGQRMTMTFDTHSTL